MVCKFENCNKELGRSKMGNNMAPNGDFDQTNTNCSQCHKEIKMLLFNFIYIC